MRVRATLFLIHSVRVSGTALRISVAFPPKGQSSGRALEDGASADSVRIPQFRESFFQGGCVCLCARRSRQTIWCRVLRSPDRAAAATAHTYTQMPLSPPRSQNVFRTPSCVDAPPPPPGAPDGFHTNSWLRGISWEPLEGP